MQMPITGFRPDPFAFYVKTVEMYAAFWRGSAAMLPALFPAKRTHFETSVSNRQAF
jgi:hypothetical protein